jgi:hypothetical protein
MYVGSVTAYQETLQTVLSYTIDYSLQLTKTKIWHQFTYVLQVEGLFEFLHKMILQQRAINKIRNCLNMVYNSRDLQQG